MRRQTPRRQRRGTGRQDQGDRTRRRSHPAHRLRQHTRRRAGDQERRIRLHHQRRRQQQDPAATEPCDGEGADAAPTGAFRGETLRRTFVRPHHRFVGGAPTGREPRAQSRCDGHVGTAHRRDRNGQGGLRAGDPPGRAARQRDIRGGQLLGLLQRAARKRTLRPPRRQFHGCDEGQKGAVRRGRQGNAVSRRNRRNARRIAGQAAARARKRRIHQDRRDPPDESPP